MRDLKPFVIIALLCACLFLFVFFIVAECGISLADFIAVDVVAELSALGCLFEVVSRYIFLLFFLSRGGGGGVGRR